MTQAKSASERPPKVERKDNVLDASKLEAVRADATKKAEDGNSKPVVSATAAAS